MRFEKKRQRINDSIDGFLDDLESVRRRRDPEESTNGRNFSITSKLIDGVKSDDLRTMLETYYTPSKDNAPTPEEMRQKSRDNMLMKPKKNQFKSQQQRVDVVQAEKRYGQTQVVCKMWVDRSSHGGLNLSQTRYEKPGLCIR